MNRKVLPKLILDFDGVIVQFNKNWNGKPQSYKDMIILPDARKIINLLYNKYQIIIFSARFNPDLFDDYLTHLCMVKNFLTENDIRFDYCTCFKEIGTIIDDDCVKFTDWSSIADKFLR